MMGIVWAYVTGNVAESDEEGIYLGTDKACPVPQWYVFVESVFYLLRICWEQTGLSHHLASISN